MTATDADIAALTARIAAGDPEAFGVFYDAWFTAALALARAVGVRDEAGALDVVQDVMVRVVDRMPPLASERAVAAWLSKVVHGVAVDRRRKEQRRRRREEFASQASMRDGGPEPDTVLAEREQTAWLEARLAEMPAPDRDLVFARFSGDGSVAQVAAALGMSANSGHGRLRRALDRLRRAARDWLDG